jgi:hypothetical protein
MKVEITGGRKGSSLTLNSPSTLRFDGGCPNGQRSDTLAVTITTGNATCMLAIHSEEDIKLSPPSWLINPYPGDGRCQCCGKHLNELEPFTLIGHPSGLDFEGVRLVKNLRPMAPRDLRVDRTMKEFFGGALDLEGIEKAWERLKEVYGQERAEFLCAYSDHAITARSSWECWECNDLEDEAYFEVKDARHSHDPDYLIPVNLDEMVQPLAVLPETKNP